MAKKLTYIWGIVILLLMNACNKSSRIVFISPDGHQTKTISQGLYNNLHHRTVSMVHSITQESDTTLTTETEEEDSIR